MLAQVVQLWDSMESQSAINHPTLLSFSLYSFHHLRDRKFQRKSFRKNVRTRRGDSQVPRLSSAIPSRRPRLLHGLRSRSRRVLALGPDLLRLQPYVSLPLLLLRPALLSALGLLRRCRRQAFRHRRRRRSSSIGMFSVSHMLVSVFLVCRFNCFGVFICCIWI